MCYVGGMRLALVPRVPQATAAPDRRCSGFRFVYEFQPLLSVAAAALLNAGETSAEKRACCGCCLTSNVTVFRVAPSVGDRAGASRRKIDLGVDGLTSAAAMPPSRQAD